MKRRMRGGNCFISVVAVDAAVVTLCNSNRQPLKFMCNSIHEVLAVCCFVSSSKTERHNLKLFRINIYRFLHELFSCEKKQRNYLY